MSGSNSNADAKNFVSIHAYHFLELQHKTLLFIESETQLALGLIADQEADATIPRSWTSRTIINSSNFRIEQLKDYAYSVRRNFTMYFDTPHLRKQYRFEIRNCEVMLEKLVGNIAWDSDTPPVTQETLPLTGLDDDDQSIVECDKPDADAKKWPSEKQ